MTPTLRAGGFPSALADGTHEDAGLRPVIAFDPDVAGAPEPLGPGAILEQVDLGSDAPRWLTISIRSIRPLCVGALMAIPTIGAASVGIVAFFSERRALAMVRASTGFLDGIPTDVVVLIGSLAVGYGFSKTVERLRALRVGR